MPERISLPKYPDKERLQGNSDLEKYLLSLESAEALYSYEELPNEFSAQAIENYANDFFTIASRSSDFNEVGAYIHLRRQPRALIFPTQMSVGRDEVTPPFARRHKHVIPVAFVHNHPTDGSFSQPPGHDIGCIINGYEDKGDNIMVPVWILSTPDDNYVIFRTKETIPRDKYELYEISHNEKSSNDFLNFRRYGAETVKNSTRELWLTLLHIVEKESFEGGLQAAYTSLYGTFAIAQECKLGFYHSYKDGKYERVTSEILDTLVSVRYEQALQKALLTMP